MFTNGGQYIIESYRYVKQCLEENNPHGPGNPDFIIMGAEEDGRFKCVKLPKGNNPDETIQTIYEFLERKNLQTLFIRFLPDNAPKECYEGMDILGEESTQIEEVRDSQGNITNVRFRINKHLPPEKRQKVAELLLTLSKLSERGSQDSGSSQ